MVAKSAKTSPSEVDHGPDPRRRHLLGHGLLRNSRDGDGTTRDHTLYRTLDTGDYVTMNIYIYTKNTSKVCVRAFEDNGSINWEITRDYPKKEKAEVIASITESYGDVANVEVL